MRPNIPASIVFAALALVSAGVVSGASVAERFQPGPQNVSNSRGLDQKNKVMRPSEQVFHSGKTNLFQRVIAAKKIPVSRRPISRHPQWVKSAPLGAAPQSLLLHKTSRVKSPASSLFRRR
jgi:hypothetical protein